MLTEEGREVVSRLSMSYDLTGSQLSAKRVSHGDSVNSTFSQFLLHQQSLPADQSAMGEFAEDWEMMLGYRQGSVSDETVGISFPAKAMEDHQLATLVTNLKGKLKGKISSAAQLVSDGGMPFFIQAMRVGFNEVGRTHLARIFQGQRSIKELLDAHSTAYNAEMARRKALEKPAEVHQLLTIFRQDQRLIYEAVATLGSPLNAVIKDEVSGEQKAGREEHGPRREFFPGNA